MINPLKDYLYQQRITVKEFCRSNHLAPATIYRLVRGESRATREVAIRIVAASEGHLKLSDFGYI